MALNLTNLRAEIALAHIAKCEDRKTLERWLKEERAMLRRWGVRVALCHRLEALNQKQGEV